MLSNLNITDRTLYKNINLLEEKGLIEKSGKNKKGVWKISINDGKNIIRDKSKNYRQKALNALDFSVQKDTFSTEKTSYPYSVKNDENTSILRHNCKQAQTKNINIFQENYLYKAVKDFDLTYKKGEFSTEKTSYPYSEKNNNIDRESYPQKEAKNFVFNGKNFVPSTEKTSYPYIIKNNKDKENKTIVIEDRKIVDKLDNLVKNLTNKLNLKECIKREEDNFTNQGRYFNIIILSIQQSLINKFGKACYRSWFSKIKFDEIKNDEVQIRVPNEFFKDYITNNYLDALLNICKLHYPSISGVSISVDQSLSNESNYDFEVINDQTLSQRQNTFYSLTKEQESKVRNYAAKLCHERLRKGYAATLKKGALEAQIIFHVSNWRPTKIQNLSLERSFDIALSIAYKKIKSGSWSTPYGFKDSNATIDLYENQINSKLKF